MSNFKSQILKRKINRYKFIGNSLMEQDLAPREKLELRNSCQRQAGFTFIELILYIAIVTTLMAALVPFTLAVIGNTTKSTTQQEVFSAGRYVSERLKYEIRNAVDIDAVNSNFDVNLATNPGTKITLTENGVTNPTIIDVASGKIQIKQGAGAAVFLQSQDTKVTNLIFTNYTSIDNKTKNIGFTLTIAANYGSTRQEYQETITIQSNAELRNN